MKREEAMLILREFKEFCDSIFSVHSEKSRAIDMAIEALSKPNYESDTEVRLAVANRNKDKVILWDAFGEVEYYPNGEINCVHCPRYYETEDDIGVHSHCGSHGRLIDADALIEDFNKLNEWLDIDEEAEIVSLINNAPIVQADRPHGEWIDKGDYAVCSKCGGSSGTQYDGVERIPRITTFCPHCGVRMTKRW